MPDGKPIPEGQNAADVGAVQQVPQIQIYWNHWEMDGIVLSVGRAATKIAA